MWSVCRVHASALSGYHSSQLPSTWEGTSHGWKERPAAPRPSSTGKENTAPSDAFVLLPLSLVRRAVRSPSNTPPSNYTAEEPSLHLFPTSLTTTFVFNPLDSPRACPLLQALECRLENNFVRYHLDHVTVHLTHLALSHKFLNRELDSTAELHPFPFLSFPSFFFTQRQQALENLILRGRLRLL